MPKWFKFWPFVTILIAIFWLSVIKTPSLKFSDHWFWDNFDKFGHAIAYAALCFSGNWSLYSISELKKISGQKILAVALFSFLYGLMIEFLQHFLPHRSFDPFDMIANAVGITLGAAVSARLFTKSFVS